MKYISTRTPGVRASLSEAVEQGLAPDGGLYVPEHFPHLYLSDFGAVEGPVEVGRILLAPFFDGDRLEDSLDDVCAEAFDFPLPLREVTTGTSVLELFHGPTAAFKDVGARFLAAALSRLNADRETPLTILVATSGDTGGAVAAAFHGKPGVRVVVLYPEGRVSPRQEKQLTVWGDNVTALAVRGDFDDCQRMVKEALRDRELQRRVPLSSANSINLGRLLPQMVYYADASLRYLRETGVAPGFIVPTGNLGNAVACLWARQVGLPIREVVVATNANPAISNYLTSGQWQPQPTIATLATAMDVGDPSNFERLDQISGGWTQARRRMRAVRVSDEEIRSAIQTGMARWGEVWDPHTATAIVAREQLDTPDWIVVATAHPAKFESVVEPLIGRGVEVPPELARLLERPGKARTIEPTTEALREVLEG